MKALLEDESCVTSRYGEPTEHRFTSWVSPAGDAQAGGDWCDVVQVSDGAFTVSIGDVSGHGAAVAKSMTAIRSSILQAMRDIRRPSHILAVANAVATHWLEDVVVTAIIAIVDLRRNIMTFANAGHPPPLLLTGNRHAFLAKSPGDLPLGVLFDYDASDHMISLPPDSLMVFYTDGVTEHDRDSIAGENELVDAAIKAHGTPHVDAARAIAASLLDKRRGEDDAATLCLRVMANCSD